MAYDVPSIRHVSAFRGSERVEQTRETHMRRFFFFLY